MSKRGVRASVPEGFCTVEDAALRTGISKSTLRRWRVNGYFVPQHFEQHGKYSVPYYSDQEVKTLRKIKKLGIVPRYKNKK